MKLNKTNNYLVAEAGHKTLSICLPGMKEVAVLTFPEKAISDMEIVNQKELAGLVNQFLSGLKLPKSEIILIFHDTLCFEMNLSGLAVAEQINRYNSFLETVPLESVIARKIVVDEKTAFAAAINRRVYEFFRERFAALGNEVSAAVPAVVISSIGYAGQLSGPVCMVLSKKIKQLKSWSFFDDHNPTEYFAKTQRHFVEKHRLLFGVVSTAFVAVALVTSVLTLKPATPKPKVIPVIAKEATSTPGPLVILEPTLVPTNTAELVTVIVNGSNSPNPAQLLRAEFIRIGITKIELKSAAAPAELTQVSFSHRVSTADQNSISEFLKKSYLEVVVTTSEDKEVDITVTTGQLI